MCWNEVYESHNQKYYQNLQNFASLLELVYCIRDFTTHHVAFTLCQNGNGRFCSLHPELKNCPKMYHKLLATRHIIKQDRDSHVKNKRRREFLIASAGVFKQNYIFYHPTCTAPFLVWWWTGTGSIHPAVYKRIPCNNDQPVWISRLICSDHESENMTYYSLISKPVLLNFNDESNIFQIRLFQKTFILWSIDSYI